VALAVRGTQQMPSGANRQTSRRVFGERITPNLTQERQTGIGAWTSGQIKTALTKGLRPDGHLLASPMPWRYLSTMKDEDISAIVAFLQTADPGANLDPISNTPLDETHHD
jgi:hypothetical protein